MVVSHNHPASETEDVQGMMRNIFSNLQVDFRLRNLPGSSKSRVTDVYCPEVRRSPLRDNLNVNHLDVVSCWKGLSFHQASEIAYWESTFKSCLEETALDFLAVVFGMYLREQCHGPLTQPSVLACLKNFVSVNARCRPIDVSVPDLVTDMIAKFFGDGHNRVFRWFTSTHNLPAAVYNFVRTRDCFLNSSPYPKLELDLAYEKNEAGGIHIIGDVHWQLPIIDFINLPVKLPPGAEYRIIPQYREPVLSESFTIFPVEPEFIVSSKTLPHAWDPSKSYFRTLIPDEKSQQSLKHIVARSLGSDQQCESHETMFSARLVTTFPDGVRFEQTTRYSIKLEIEPKPHTNPSQPARHTSWTHHVPLDDATPTPTEETVSVHLSPQCQASPGPGRRDPHHSQARVSSWLPSYSNTPLSKRGHDSLFDGSMPDDSPHTSSVDRGLRSAANTAISEPRNRFSGLTDTRQWLSDSAPRDSRMPGQGMDWSSNSSMSSSPNSILDDEADRLIQGFESPRGRPRTRIDCFDSLRESCANAFRNIEKRTAPRTPFFQHRVNSPQLSNPRKAADDRITITGLSQPDGAWSNEATPGSTFNSTNVSLGRNAVPQKRKATKQVPATAAAMFKLGQVFAEQRLALEEMERAGVEVADKRQRLSFRDSIQGAGAEHPDVIVDADGPIELEDDVSALANTKTETGRLGEACGTNTQLPSPVESAGWFERLKEMEDGHDSSFGGDGAPASMSVLWNVSKSRAYQSADGKGKVMPGLKKGGSVKRMVFPRQRPAPATTTAPTGADTASVTTPASYTTAAPTTFIIKGKYTHIDPTLWRNPLLSSTPAQAQPTQTRKEKRKETVEEAQRRIKENFSEFLKGKQERERHGSSVLQIDGKGSEAVDEDVKAMEAVFLAESGSEGSEGNASGSGSGSADELGAKVEDEKESLWEDEASAMEDGAGDDGDGSALSEVLEKGLVLEGC